MLLKDTMYKKFFKRLIDIFVSAAVLVLLLPLMILLIITGAIFCNGDPFFTQFRPGKNEKIFRLVKFRTMTNKKGPDGELLPDAQRLTGYGKFLRNTSLDELPELFNILKGDMSLVGPRPLLVRDMVFMTDDERRRHTVRQGLTGLAQVNGRNNITWKQKLEYDLRYIDNGITFAGDIKIVLQTVGKVLKRSDIVREGTASDMDYGDWLLLEGKIDRELYDRKQEEARVLLRGQ